MGIVLIVWLDLAKCGAAGTKLHPVPARSGRLKDLRPVMGESLRFAESW